MDIDAKSVKPEDALQRAAEIVGSRAALGRAIGTSRRAPVHWKRCPAERVLAVEAATEGQVTRHQLRPDIYPPEDHRTAAKTEAA